MDKLFESLFGEGKDFTPEFQTKITTLFEAAVSQKVNALDEAIKTANEKLLKEQAEQTVEMLVGKVNDYLTYIAEEWMKENSLTLEKGLSTELTESFLSGLKNLFEDHWIEVPDEKVDVVSSLSEEVESLRKEKDSIVEKNIELSKQLKAAQKESIFEKMTVGLANTEIDRLKILSEGIVFENVDDYKKRLNVIAEAVLKKTICEDCDGDGKDDEEDKGKKENPFDKKKDDEEDDEKKEIEEIAKFISTSQERY
jgi:hypothetical protein